MPIWFSLIDFTNLKKRYDHQRKNYRLENMDGAT